MSEMSRRRRIVAYTALLVLLNLAALLPGSLHYSTHSAFIWSAAIQALIVWRLWHDSTLAWLFALALATFTPVMMLAAESPLEPDVFFVFFISIAQAALLYTRPLRPWARDPALGRPA